jgi:ABC-type bacteriocin/lantibiotic exporter with double-glycine peptidase domain
MNPRERSVTFTTADARAADARATSAHGQLTMAALAEARILGFPLSSFAPGLRTLLSQYGRVLSPGSQAPRGGYVVIPLAVIERSQHTEHVSLPGDLLDILRFEEASLEGEKSGALTTTHSPRTLGETVLVAGGAAVRAWLRAEDGERSGLEKLRAMASARVWARSYFPWADINGGEPWCAAIARVPEVALDTPRAFRGVCLLETGRLHLSSPRVQSEERDLHIDAPAAVALLPSSIVRASPDAVCFPMEVPEDYLRHALALGSTKGTREDARRGVPSGHEGVSGPSGHSGPSGPSGPSNQAWGLRAFHGHPFATLITGALPAGQAAPGVTGCLAAASALLDHPLAPELVPAGLHGRDEECRDVLWLGDLLERAGLRTFSCALSAKEIARLETPFLCRLARSVGSPQGELALLSASRSGRVLVVGERMGLTERTVGELMASGREIRGILLWSSEMFRPDSLGDALAGDDDDEDNDARKVTKKLVRKRLARMLTETVRLSLPLMANRFLLGVLAMGVGLAIPAISQSLIDSSFSTRDMGLARVLIFTLACVLAAQFLLNVLAEGLWARLQWRISTRLDGVVYRQMFRSLADWRDALGLGTGQAWLREAEQLKLFFLRELPTFAIELLTVLTVFLVLVAKSPTLGLLPLGGFAVCFLAWFLYRSTIRRNETSGFLLASATGNLLIEHVRGMETIRSLGGSPRLVAQWRALAQESCNRDVNIARQQSALDTFTGCVALVCEALSLFIVCVLAAQGARTVGEVVSVAMYLSLLFAPMSNLTSFYDRYRRARASFKRLHEMFLTSRDELAAESPLFNRDHFGCVRFEGASVTLRDGRAVGLGEGTFLVRPQDRVVVHGGVGSGKSQLARLLALRDEPAKGRVFLDDRPLANLSARTVGMHVALLQRNTRPLGASVAELLTYGTTPPEGGDARERSELEDLCALIGLTRALEEGGLSPSASTLAHGAPLPENVLQLSALVRTLRARPRIVVLDDALAGLTAPEERETLERVFARFPEITFVVLTRREELLSLTGARGYRLEGGAAKEV